MTKLSELFVPDSEWVIVDDGSEDSHMNYRLGYILIFKEFSWCQPEASEVGWPDPYYAVSFIDDGTIPPYAFIPTDDQFTIIIPLSLFDEKEQFLIKMTGEIGKVEWQSKVTNLNRIYEYENDVGIPVSDDADEGDK